MTILLDNARKIRVSLESRAKNHDQVHVQFHDDDSFTILCNSLDTNNRPKRLTYKPEPTFKRIHKDRSHPVKHVQGPYSSGKSVGNLADLFLQLRDMPVCKDGIRRARTGVVRSTYGELRATTIKTFLDWFGDFGYAPPGQSKTFIKSPYPEFKVRFKDDRGELEWEVLFIALEKESDVEKLGSWELTNMFINEARGIARMIYENATGRVGRFPKEEDFPEPEVDMNYYCSLNSDTNPPTPNQWLYELYENERPDGYAFYQQAPAVVEDESTGQWVLNPLADNLSHNKPDYYLNMIKGKSREFIRVYAQGMYGAAAEGKKVFEDYNDDIHSVQQLEWIEGEKLYLGWDIKGLTPCLLICQLVNGQLRVMKEFITESMGVENLITDRVKPWWKANNMDRFEVEISVADPAGGVKSERNVHLPNLIQLISSTFLPTTAALTNAVEIRLEAVRYFMLRMTGGKPALIIDRESCPILREGFNGFYKLKEKQVAGKGEKFYELKPDKSHPHSEPQDCLQYVALSLYRAANKPQMDDEPYSQRKLQGLLNHGKRGPRLNSAA